MEGNLELKRTILMSAHTYMFIKNEICIQDFLQNSINLCKEMVFQEFGIALDKWQDIEK